MWVRLCVYVLTFACLLVDETTLTLFNTTSDQSSTYPLFLSCGLLPKSARRKPGNLVNIALLPRFLKRLHRGAGANKRAHLKRLLVWAAMKVVLGDLLDPEPDSPVAGYWSVSCVLL